MPPRNFGQFLDSIFGNPQCWGEERERYLALHGHAQPQKEVPTLEEFSKRFIEDNAKAQTS